MPHGDQARNEGKTKRTRITELRVPFSGKARKSQKNAFLAVKKIIRGTLTLRPFHELRLETEIGPKSPVLSLSLGISGFLNSVSDGFCENDLEIGLRDARKSVSWAIARLFRKT